MVRFGKIISIDRLGSFAIIRENTPRATEFLVMSSELSQVPTANKNAEVSFVKDPEFSSNVATLIKVHRTGKAA